MYILSVGRKALDERGVNIVSKVSVKVFFTNELNGVKRNLSRTVNYVNSTASNDDLGAFKGAFSALLGKEVKRAVKISVEEL